MLTEDGYCDPYITPIEEVTDIIQMRQKRMLNIYFGDAKIDHLCDRHNILITGGFAD